MIGKLLCRHGHHKWIFVGFYYGSWVECARCGSFVGIPNE